MSTATIHEAMGRKGALDSHIKPISRGMKLAGPAITVEAPFGDNLMLHKAIEVAGPGDVIVCNAGGGTEAGVWGEIMAVAAQARGIAGIVVDGSVRDSEAMTRRGFPVFSRGICIKGTIKESLGPINHPMSLAGVMIFPGDIVVGDDDGVVVIPRNDADTVLKKCQEREAKEKGIMKRLEAGELTLDIYGFRETLSRNGLTEE
jgi:4-hydroxy-4-methyl-2-oxoglutarate aldolase